MKFFIGKKLGMTTIFTDEGKAENVTLLSVVPSTVGLVRTEGRDGYTAVQLTVAKTPKKTATYEFAITDAAPYVPAAAYAPEIAVGNVVAITAPNKAKGFQGGVKRHGFKGQTSSHGRKHDMRKPGALGSATPQKVFKGQRMAGRMGGEITTTTGLKVVYYNATENILAVRGAVPGVAGRLVRVQITK